jgi:hypothetical protein
MTDYSAIIETETDPGAPSKSTLWKRFWKNPLAMFEGAVGAPRLMDAALDTSAPSAAGATWIGARQALATAGAIGTLAFASNQSTGNGTVLAGATVAGSSLKYSGGAGVSSTVLSGTWRCMGYCRTDTSANIPLSDSARSTLWLRIA